ncbi:hypothetical protein BZG82_13125, partial [Salinivibrio sp. PR5]|uniref:GapS1 family protein n=1 Tax=Salinivibrio sp. PR5 TaxID=1909484 RepID=UPI00098B707D
MYERKVGKIKKAISRYTTESLAENMLIRLRSSYDGKEIQNIQPWCVCLCLEWILEQYPNDKGVHATNRDAQKILQKVWDLQNEALDLENKKESYTDVLLALRPFIHLQGLYQKQEHRHIQDMLRTYHILQRSNRFDNYKSDFLESTGIEIREFLIVGLFLILLFQKKGSVKSNSIPTSEIIRELHPSISIDSLIRIINSTGFTLESASCHLKNKSKKTNSPSECYSPTFFNQKPILIYDSKLYPLHPVLVSSGISSFIFNTLKERDPNKFKTSFTKDFEDYISDLLEDAGEEFIREGSIREKCGANNKVVDFLINDYDTVIFIDAKGQEPHKNVVISDSKTLLKNRISKTLYHAVEQASLCCKELSKKEENNIPSYERRFAVIVTHHSYFFSRGSHLVELLGDDNTKRLIQSCNDIIPLENIFFLSCEELELLGDILNNTRFKIKDFLSHCLE